MEPSGRAVGLSFSPPPPAPEAPSHWLWQEGARAGASGERFGAAPLMPTPHTQPIPAAAPTLAVGLWPGQAQMMAAPPMAQGVLSRSRFFSDESGACGDDAELEETMVSMVDRLMF